MSELDLATAREALIAASNAGCRHLKLTHGKMAFEAVLPEDVEADDEWDGYSEGGSADAGGPQFVDVVSSFVGVLQMTKPLAEGDPVEADQVLGQVVALGFPNDVKAKTGGVFAEWLVEAGETVDFGRAIARIQVD